MEASKLLKFIITGTRSKKIKSFGANLKNRENHKTLWSVSGESAHCSVRLEPSSVGRCVILCACFGKNVKDTLSCRKIYYV